MPTELKEPERYVEIDGRELRYLRKKAKLTQQQLVSLVAREHQLTRGYMPTIEKNPQARVSKALAKELASALEVSVTGCCQKHMAALALVMLVLPKATQRVAVIC
jgi:transcriptional regulator with XRE-family HTH domain